MAFCPGHRDQTAMTARQLTLTAVLSATLLLGACTSKPVPPDWQGNAFAALKGYSAAYLSGNTRLADFEFSRAKTEISSTGRPDWLARAELTRCAVRSASLEFDQCAGYQPLAQDARADEQAYADFLSGRWTGLNVTLLPPQYRTLVQQALAAQAQAAALETGGLLGTIENPLARLVAAAVLLQNKQLTAAGIDVATETASSQGWRRPLLAWLGLQRQRASEAGEPAAAARLQRRIDLVLQAAHPTR